MSDGLASRITDKLNTLLLVTRALVDALPDRVVEDHAAEIEAVTDALIALSDRNLYQ